VVLFCFVFRCVDRDTVWPFPPWGNDEGANLLQRWAIAKARKLWVSFDQVFEVRGEGVLACRIIVLGASDLHLDRVVVRRGLHPGETFEDLIFQAEMDGDCC
jgi:hypothetical protein